MRLTEWIIRFLFIKGVGKLIIVIWNFSNEFSEVFHRYLARRMLPVEKDYIIITIAVNTAWRISKVLKQSCPHSYINLLGDLFPYNSLRLILCENKITGLFRYVELSNTHEFYKPEDNSREVCIYLCYPNGKLTELNIKYVQSLILAQFRRIHMEKGLLP